MKKRVIPALLGLLCFGIALALPAAAEESAGAGAVNRLTLHYTVNETGDPMPGVTFYLYKVGEYPSAPNEDSGTEDNNGGDPDDPDSGDPDSGDSGAEPGGGDDGDNPGGGGDGGGDNPGDGGDGGGDNPGDGGDGGEDNPGDGGDGEELQFVPAEAFAAAFQDIDIGQLSLKLWKDSGYAGKLTDLAESIVPYSMNVEPVATARTNKQGYLIFRNLEPGLYLVRGMTSEIGGTVYIPYAFLIPLPYPGAVEGEFNRKVQSDVKYEIRTPAEIPEIRITVQKKWAPEGETHPDSATVQLLRDGAVDEEVTLNAGNNWSYTWTRADSGAVWKVAEKDVPAGYTASVAQDGYRFTVTNTRAGAGGPGSDATTPGGWPGGWPGNPADPNEPVLNTQDHYAYLVGYEEDGTIRPNANITRAETVTIFFRLLTDEVRDRYWATANSYPDVGRTAWYNTAISTMTRLGVVEGYPDGTFRPDASITRAELTKIAVSFFHYTDLQLTGSTRFDDVPQDKWYTRFVEAAAEMGLISGYPDNTFRPEQAITRAETVSIINRVLGRRPHRDGLLETMITWPDNMDVDAWYYAGIQEATNSHDFQLDLYDSDNVYEHWTGLRPVRDWAALERFGGSVHSVHNPGEVMDMALPGHDIAGEGSREKRDEEAEE